VENSRFTFFFCLETKEAKIQGSQIKRLKNHVRIPFRAPSRSPCRLDSWSAATSSFLAFLTFYLMPSAAAACRMIVKLLINIVKRILARRSKLK